MPSSPSRTWALRAHVVVGRDVDQGGVGIEFDLDLCRCECDDALRDYAIRKPNACLWS